MDSYWHSRQTLADAAMEKDERALSIRVHNAYESELRRLNREIAEYYQRYGENGVLEYRRLMETMDPKDRELLIRDCDEFLRQHPFSYQSECHCAKTVVAKSPLQGDVHPNWIRDNIRTIKQVNRLLILIYIILN